MAEPDSNPFDQPYPSNGTPSAPTPPPGLVVPTPPPRLVIPDDSPPSSDSRQAHDSDGGYLHESVTSNGSADEGTASSHTMLNASQGTQASGANRRVQWPANLPDQKGHSHVAIDMAQQVPTSPSGRNLTSPGAQAELVRALEAAADAGTDDDDEIERRSRYIGGEGGASRAASSDGDPEERLEALKDNMEVFVDPGERDGLPSTSKRDPAEKSTRAAWGLVRGLTHGGHFHSSLRRRKQSEAPAAPGGFTSGTGANAEDDKKGEGEEEAKSTGETLRERLRRADVQDLPPDASYASNGLGSGGILSALIALQQQQQAAARGGSASVSGATTPASLGPSSRASSIAEGDDTDEEEEEAERLRFLAKLHEKRAQKNRLHNLAGGLASGATGVAVGAGRGANAVIGTAGRGAGAVIGTAGRGAGAVIGGAGKAVGAAGTALGVNAAIKSHSKTPSVEHTPATGEEGEAKKRRGILDRTRNAMGLDERPEAAKSGAGVFGGLVLGAGSLAGVATPQHAALAPDPTKAGHTISRWELAKDGGRSRSGSVEGSSTQGSPVVARSALSTPPLSPGHEKRNPFSLSLGNLKDLPLHTPKFGHSPGHGSPRKELGDYFTKETEEEADRKAWEKEKRRRRKAREKRKAQEVFITQHVAAIIERQQFIMKMARAFMMFGAPSHRLEAQMQATARVLEINCQVIYIPGVMMLSFGDAATHTSDIKFLKQANGLDLGKLMAAYLVYFNVIHDRVSVTEASRELDELMVSPPKYALWQQLIIGACASAFIQPSAFYGSFIDCLMAMPLGSLLVLVQVLVSRNDLYSSLFEIVIACIISFISAALASTQYFCFAAVVSGSVVLILPGYIVLCGSLELANRSIISGSVRLVYAILYSLFLGFGLSIGSELYNRTGLTIYGLTDYTCSSLRGTNAKGWWMDTIPAWWYFLTIPMFLLTLSVRNGQPLFRKETPVMILIGCAGFVSNYFSGKAFKNRSDIASAIGSFAVGFLSNVYGKFTRGSAFVVAVPGVLVQLPSGLSNGGLLRFADANSSDTYSSGFATAESLVEVAIGLTVGLFVSAAVVNLLLGGGRRRGSNLSSF
ncbi:Uncharacterized UPF0442 protein C7D4.12c [Rhodotorula toruloides]|nr:Uncharacterized UPF0442 protein C7D4.12c [Rhodotorula toruloides]